MQRIRDRDELEGAVESLIAAEPRFARVLARHGLPRPRAAPPGLETLLRIVTDQLISLKAGEAIWRRLEAGLGGLDPDSVLSCPESRLQGFGLSAAKARCFHAAARAFADGRFAQLADGSMPEAELLRRLTAIPGVGPWTANIYLLTAVGWSDAWPAADLALQEAARDLFGLAQRPQASLMDQLAEPWRPHRAAAALLLWSHYRELKGLPQA